MPGQRDRKEQDDEVGENGDGEIHEEDLSLVQTVPHDVLVPVRSYRVADDRFQHLDGKIENEDEDDEGIYSPGDALLYGKDARDEQQECRLGEEGCRTVGDGACI